MARKDNFEDELEKEFEEPVKDEEFSEDEEFEKQEQEELASKQPMAVRRVPSEQPRPVERPRQKPSPIAEPRKEVPATNKFNVYSIPERVGIMDAENNTPLFEAAEPNALIMLAMVEILNKLERIERNLGL